MLGTWNDSFYKLSLMDRKASIIDQNTIMNIMIIYITWMFAAFYVDTEN